jgi:hypothetical protein
MVDTLLISFAVAEAGGAVCATEEDGVAGAALVPGDFPIVVVRIRGDGQWAEVKCSLVLQFRFAGTVHFACYSKTLSEEVTAGDLAYSPGDETRAVEASAGRSFAVTTAPYV